MYAARKPKSKLKFVTLDKKSNMSTLQRREDFLRICSKEDLAEKAQATDVTIPVKRSQGKCYDLTPMSLSINRFKFQGRRPDSVAISEALKIVCILESKRPTDKDEEFLEVKEAGANKQRKSIMSALRAATPTWVFELINFVVGHRGLWTTATTLLWASADCGQPPTTLLWATANAL